MKNRNFAMRLAFVLPLLTWLLSAPAIASQGSCVMPTVGTVSGLTLVNDINACNSALLSLYSGASAPGSPTTGMLWYNTTTNYIQQYDGASWLNLWLVDASNHLTSMDIGGGITSQTIASAATTDLGSIKQPFKTISGTTTITSLGSSAKVGSIHVVVFSGVLTLTHNATSLILPGGANKTTAAGDNMVALYLGSSNWRVLTYTPAIGTNVTAIDSKTGNFTTGVGITSTVGNQIKLALNSATLQASPGGPAGTTSSTAVMMGLGSTCTITPVYSTRVKVEFQGYLTDNAASNAATTQARFGTGTAPTNGAALTGTTVGSAVLAVGNFVNYIAPFKTGGIITGLTPGTAYWLDLSLSTQTAGSTAASVVSLSCEGMEF